MPKVRVRSKSKMPNVTKRVHANQRATSKYQLRIPSKVYLGYVFSTYFNGLNHTVWLVSICMILMGLFMIN